MHRAHMATGSTKFTGARIYCCTGPRRRPGDRHMHRHRHRPPRGTGTPQTHRSTRVQATRGRGGGSKRPPPLLLEGGDPAHHRSVLRSLRPRRRLARQERFEALCIILEELRAPARVSSGRRRAGAGLLGMARAGRAGGACIDGARTVLACFRSQSSHGILFPARERMCESSFAAARSGSASLVNLRESPFACKTANPNSQRAWNKSKEGLRLFHGLLSAPEIFSYFAIFSGNCILAGARSRIQYPVVAPVPSTLARPVAPLGL